MSTYSSSRKGPNMSQYIANLNTDTPPTDDLFSAQDDLSLFANTEFFDFDMSDQLHNLPGDFEASVPNKKSSTAGWQSASATASGQDFLDADFNFGDLQNFGSIGAGASATGTASGNALNYPLTAPSGVTSPASASSPTSAAPRVGEKRKSVAASSDEAARHAAEEDKRRRNTAASARFRVKKKQREQALEKTAKEMTERAQMLETKVQQLEMENKWLKGLITEREIGGDSKVGTVIGKGALEELFEKYKRDERSKSSDADGESDD